MSASWAQVLLMALSALVGAAVPAVVMAWRLSSSWTRVQMTVTQHGRDIESQGSRITALETRRSGVW